LSIDKCKKDQLSVIITANQRLTPRRPSKADLAKSAGEAAHRARFSDSVYLPTNLINSLKTPAL